MLLTQEPTTKIYIKKRKRKIASTHAFQNYGMIYCYIPSSCKSQLQNQVLKENQCIVTWGHANSQVGGGYVEPQKDHILFIISYTIYHLTLLHFDQKSDGHIVGFSTLPCRMYDTMIFFKASLECRPLSDILLIRRLSDT